MIACTWQELRVSPLRSDPAVNMHISTGFLYLNVHSAYCIFMYILLECVIKHKTTTGANYTELDWDLTVKYSQYYNL